MEVTDKLEVRALGQGINLTVLRESLHELEHLCNVKIDAQEQFKNAVQLVALRAGIIPGVLTQYITARCTDTVKKKAQSSEQLSLLFGEVGG